MKQKLKNTLLRLDFILVVFSLFLSIYAFCGSNICLLRNDGSSMVFNNHSRNFLVSKESDKVKIFDGDKQIREIKVPDDFSFDKMSYSSNSGNCAFVAAVASGATLEAAGSGFVATFGLATTELEGLFAMAAEGATVAEVSASIIGIVGFWVFAAAGVAIVA